MRLSEAQKQVRESARLLARNVVEPLAKQVDEAGEFPWSHFQTLGEQGYFGLPIPTAYGGGGKDLLSSTLAVEEIAAARGSTSVLLCTQALASYAVLLGGTQEQKVKFLPRLATGAVPGAFCVTEAGAGSDVSNVQTTAATKDDGYVLNGSKVFITNAGEAGVYVILARTSEHRSRGLSLFVVEQGTPGLSFGELEEKMGVRGSVSRAVLLEDVWVPRDHLLGEEGKGFGTIMEVFNRTRILVGAQAVGLAQGAMRIALDYLKERQQFGKPLSEQQMLQGILADLAMQIEASRLLVYQAAGKIDDGEASAAMFTSMAKCFATDMAMRVTTEAVQLLGDNGYSKKYPVERMMRDALVVARELLKG